MVNNEKIDIRGSKNKHVKRVINEIDRAILFIDFTNFKNHKEKVDFIYYTKDFIGGWIISLYSADIINTQEFMAVSKYARDLFNSDNFEDYKK